MGFSWFVGFSAADDQVVPALRSDNSRVGRETGTTSDFTFSQKRGRISVQVCLSLCPVQVSGRSLEQAALTETEI